MLSSPPPLRVAEPETTRLSRLELLVYSVGWIAHSIVGGITSLLYLYYNVELGFSAVAIGVILGFGRAYDAFTDVYMGNLSDNFQSRHGRRRPFVFIGSITLALTIPLLFAAPDTLEGGWLGTFLAVALLLQLTAYTAYVVPLLALGFEMGVTSRERTRIQAWRAVTSAVGAGLVSWAYHLAQHDWFSSATQGFRVTGVAMGLVAGATGVLPALFCRERQPKATKHAMPMKLMTAVLTTARNGPFVRLMSFTMAFLFGTTIVSAIGVYVGIYLLFDGDKQAAALIGGVGGSFHQVYTLAGIPFVVWLSRRYGKKNAVGFCLWLCFLGSLSKLVTYDPRWPYLHIYTSLPLLGVGGSCFWVVVSAMKADICDHDELSTGRRREGSYAAVSQWFQKLAIVVAVMMGGLLVPIVGIDPSLSSQTPESRDLLRLYFALPPALFFAVALLAWQRYPLTDEEVVRIQAELKTRRDAASREAGV